MEVVVEAKNTFVRESPDFSVVRREREFCALNDGMHLDVWYTSA